MTPMLLVQGVVLTILQAGLWYLPVPDESLARRTVHGSPVVINPSQAPKAVGGYGWEQLARPRKCELAN